CDIADPNSHVPMLNFPVLDERIDCRSDNLGGNCKAHAGEPASLRNQERVDAYHFTMRVNQRTSGIAGVDGSIGLNELSGRTTVLRVRIGTIQCAYNSAGNSEAETQRIAKSQHRLPRV